MCVTNARRKQRSAAVIINAYTEDVCSLTVCCVYECMSVCFRACRGERGREKGSEGLRIIGLGDETEDARHVPWVLWLEKFYFFL